MMIMKPIEIFEHVARGFVEGMGVDSLTWIASAYYPDLAKPSPLKIPGYDPAGTHYDDIISLGVSGAVAVFGAVKKDWNVVAEGISMIAGAFILSKHQPAASPAIWTSSQKFYPITPTFAATQFSDLVKVD